MEASTNFGDYAISEELGFLCGAIADMIDERVSYSQRMNMSPLARLTNQFLGKMENCAAAEGTRLRRSNHGKLRLIGTATGILVVILLGLWMAYRP